MATTFDYNGPPVNVSNGMAMQLVAQFGVKNAWFAFLKLRGMKTTHEIDEAEKEKKAYAYFRNKIGNLRRQINEQKIEDDEACPIMEENFDNFLSSFDSFEICADAPEYVEMGENELTDSHDTAVLAGEIGMPTTASLLEVIEQNKLKKYSGNHKNAKLNENQATQIAQKDVSTSESGKGGKIKNNREKVDDPETKQVVEKLLAAKEEIARRHAETIDDVVSLVMEKIRNNQPFEGELALGPTGHLSGPPKSHHKRAMGLSQRLQKGSQRKVDPQLTEPQVQSIGQFQPEKGIGSMGSNVVAQANSFSHLPSGQILLFHNTATGTVQIPSYSIAHASKMHQGTGGDQVAILGNFPDIITSTATTHSFQSSSGHYSKSGGVSHQQQIIGDLMEPNTGESESDGGTTATTIPIDLAIQKNMTIQELIQALKVQSRHQNAQIILHHNSISTTSSNQQQLQQETPDSSSQEATIQESQKMQSTKKIMTEKKNRKRKIVVDGNEQNETATKQSTVTPQKKTLENMKPDIVNTMDNKKKKSKNTTSSIINAEDEKKSQNSSPVSSTKLSTADHKQKQQISDLESQIQKINKQLAAEKNKSTSMKKRVEKLQLELDKSQDSIQLFQIDLACQKTDNNNLIAENISLKAENQQLRSKSQRVATVTNLSGNSNLILTTNSSSSSHDIGRGRKKKSLEQEITKVKPGRGRKPIISTATNDNNKSTSAATSSEQMPPPPPYILSSELGRRQSKRICVTRNQFMKNMF